MCEESKIESPFSASVFGKVIKRTFPDLRYRRKRTKGRINAHYEGLYRLSFDDSDQACAVHAKDELKQIEAKGKPREPIMKTTPTIKREAIYSDYDEGDSCWSNSCGSGDDQELITMWSDWVLPDNEARNCQKEQTDSFLGSLHNLAAHNGTASSPSLGDTASPPPGLPPYLSFSEPYGMELQEPPLSTYSTKDHCIMYVAMIQLTFILIDEFLQRL